MISSVTGEIREVTDDPPRVYLAVGPFTLELLVPTSEVPALQAARNQAITFHTWLYLEGDSGGGNSYPRLVGFAREADKGFFEKFITVKGIGPKKALRALSLPTGEIAAAIEEKNTRLLSSLAGIGKRTAEQIVAELSGKVTEFAMASPRGGGAGTKLSPAISRTLRSRPEEDAIDSLVAMGDRRSDAETLLDRAKSEDGVDIADTNSLVLAMLRLRGGR